MRLGAQVGLHAIRHHEQWVNLGHKCRIALRQSDLQLFGPIAGAADDQRARGTVTPMRVSRVTSFASTSSSRPSVPAGLIGSTM